MLLIKYISFYRKFTQLSHATIRNTLSFIVFEQSMIYWSKVIKILVSANFNSPWYLFYIYLSIYFYNTWKTIYSSKKRDLIFYHSAKNKLTPTAQRGKGDKRSAPSREFYFSHGFCLSSARAILSDDLRVNLSAGKHFLHLLLLRYALSQFYYYKK